MVFTLQNGCNSYLSLNGLAEVHLAKKSKISAKKFSRKEFGERDFGKNFASSFYNRPNAGIKRRKQKMGGKKRRQTDGSLLARSQII